MAYIDVLQGALHKHLLHVGYRRGIEIFQACDAVEIGHGEPIMAAGGAGVSEGGVEDHLGDIDAIGVPFRVIAPSVHVVCRVGGPDPLIIVVES